TIMPWTLYAGMTEEDLGAIYDYLRTIAPVKNKVTKWTPNKEIADRKSTRLNSSHVKNSYAVFCLKKKNNVEKNDHSTSDISLPSLLYLAIENTQEPTRSRTLVVSIHTRSRRPPSSTLFPYTTLFRSMTEEDLGAIYDYLRTIAPVKNKVTKWTPNKEI